MQGTFWNEYPAPDATSDRGWLHAICEPYEFDHHPRYTHENTPVYDEDHGLWREQSSLGNYLDYGPCRTHRPAVEPKIHCICYANNQTKWVHTVQEAKDWIESQAASARPDLCIQMSLVAC